MFNSDMMCQDLHGSLSAETHKD